MNEKEKRGFCGVWIPALVWTDKDLSLLEKSILADVLAFDKYYKTNAKMADFFGVSKRWIQKVLSAMEAKGLICCTTESSGTGRTQGRVIRLTASYHEKLFKEPKESADTGNGDTGNSDTGNNFYQGHSDTGNNFYQGHSDAGNNFYQGNGGEAEATGGMIERTPRAGGEKATGGMAERTRADEEKDAGRVIERTREDGEKAALYKKNTVENTVENTKETTPFSSSENLPKKEEEGKEECFPVSSSETPPKRDEEEGGECFPVSSSENLAKREEEGEGEGNSISEGDDASPIAPPREEIEEIEEVEAPYFPLPDDEYFFGGSPPEAEEAAEAPYFPLPDDEYFFGAAPPIEKIEEIEEIEKIEETPRAFPPKEDEKEGESGEALSLLSPPPKEAKKEAGEGNCFQIPSLDGVLAYCKRRGYRMDARDFWEFYGKRGWMAAGRPIKDWRRLAAIWEENEGGRRQIEEKAEAAEEAAKAAKTSKFRPEVARQLACRKPFDFIDAAEKGET